MRFSHPSHWSITTLGECSTWYSGGTPRTSVPEYWNGDIPWITSSSLHDFYLSTSERRITDAGLANGSRLMPKDSILFVVRGMSLKKEFRVGIAQRPLAFGQDCKAIVANEGIEPLFLANALRALSPRILSLVSEAGHGTGRLETGVLQELEFFLPPLDEQKSIVHILGTLDDKIDLNRRMNQTLEAMAQAIFRSWFVDFDPVKAKIAATAHGRDPERAAMAALAGKLAVPKDLTAISSEELDAAEAELLQLSDEQRNQLAETAGLFPSELVESELGLIPAGWEYTNFGAIADLVKSKAHPEECGPLTPYIGLEHIGKHHFTIENWGHARDVESTKTRFEPNDFLFGKLRPYFHKVCRVPFSGICSTDILAIRPRLQAFSGFVGCQLFEDPFVAYANNASTGTRMPRASWKYMSEYPIAKPNMVLANLFSQMAEVYWGLTANNAKSSQTLAQLRDTLLPKLLSGELTVSAAEDKLEEVIA